MASLSARLMLAEAPGENSLLCVQPVLRLVPDYRLWAVDNGRGYLFAPLDRQAMHKDGVGFGMRHQMLVDPIGRQDVVTVDVRFDTHRNPGVGDDAIRPRHGFHRLGS